LSSQNQPMQGKSNSAVVWLLVIANSISLFQRAKKKRERELVCCFYLCNFLPEKREKEKKIEISNKLLKKKVW
jgi:hypothetical protein